MGTFWDVDAEIVSSAPFPFFSEKNGKNFFENWTDGGGLAFPLD